MHDTLTINAEHLVIKFSNFKIGPRLASAFGLLLVLFAVTSAVGITRLSSLNDNIDILTNRRMVNIDRARDIKDNANVVARSMRNAILADAADTIAVEVKRIDDMRAQNRQILQSLDSSITTEAGKAQVKAFVESRAAYFALVDKVIALARANKDEDARKLLLNDVRIVQTDYFKRIDAIVDSQTAAAQQTAQDAQVNYAHARTLQISLALIAIGISIGMALLITRSITRPVAEAMAVSKRIEAGDLSGEIPAGSKDEVGQLLASLRAMQTNLSNVVGGVRQSAEGVASASSQIAQGNLDLSQRTEEQASALEQTAAAMEELGSTVRTTADNAQQANQLARGAAEVASRGGEVVGEVVQTMQAINDSSKKVADIIGVIDGIAFQTNILALNAAVEAARAGEHGRGFAVVASEVRSLAQSSAQAAKEIKALIGISVEQVEKGTTLVDRAGQTMTEIVGAIQRVSHIASEIGSATKEQSTGVGQIGNAVSQMDQVTQQNAALVEESAAAAQTLKGQAQQLVDAVAVFKLADASEPLSSRHGTTPVAGGSGHPGMERTKSIARLGSMIHSAPRATQARSPAAVSPAKAGTESWDSF